LTTDYDKYLQLTDRERILIYDIEVYKEDAFVVFMNLDGSIHKIYHNDFEGINNEVEKATLVGYNNYWYDDKIVTGMLNGLNTYHLKRLNDDLIIRQQKKSISAYIHSLDCFQQLDVSKPSLKRVEANKGVSIEETPVDFTIDRKLTEEEYQEALRYCIYDVEQTRQIFFDRFDDYFLIKKMLLEMKPSLPKTAYRWNTTTLVANILLDKPFVKWSSIRVPENLLEIVPHEVREMWETKEKGNITIRKYDNDIVYGFGGLHGAHSSKKKFKNVVLLDVASLYPNIMVNFNILGSATKLFREILEERIRIKHIEGMEVRQGALKLILNSTYGLLKQEYSMLFNPKASTTVCSIGQILLTDLMERLAPTVTLVQENTDGIAFVPHTDDWKRIWKEWEEEHNFTLEPEYYDTFVQKDVNNYIALEQSGKVKTKGGDVNLYHKDSWTKPNVTRICDIAIVDYLLYDKDIIETLVENLDKPHLYQYVLQAGGTYDGTYDDDLNDYQKVNRVFATKTGNLCLYKKKGDSLNKFPNAPSKMFIWNGETKDIENFGKIVDLNHYYDLIKTKLERWE
jgi:hypothetical protein